MRHPRTTTLSVWCRFMHLRVVNIVDFSQLQYQQGYWDIWILQKGDQGETS